MNSEINVVDTFFYILKKHIIALIMIGMLASFLLTGIRWMFSNNVEKTGEYTFVRMVRVQTEEENNQFDYNAFLNSFTNYYKFIQNTPEKRFDFTQIDSAWTRKNLYEQMNWLKEKIQINSFNGNVFEVVISFDPNVTNDVAYLNVHGDFLADNFVEQSEHTIQEVAPDASFTVIDREKTMPQVTEKDQKTPLIKTGLLGFFVGFVGALIIMLLYKIRQINQIKNTKNK